MWSGNPFSGVPTRLEVLEERKLKELARRNNKAKQTFAKLKAKRKKKR